ncbi:MAG: hypothetical protein RSB82_02460 [Victivallaceae bacterium]
MDWNRNLSIFIGTLVDHVFPVFCIFCNQKGYRICYACRDGFASFPFKETICRFCVSESPKTGMLCETCNETFGIRKSLVLFETSFQSMKLIHAVSEGDKDVMRWLRDKIVNCSLMNEFKPSSIISLSHRRITYDPIFELGRAVAEKLNIKNKKIRAFNNPTIRNSTTETVLILGESYEQFRLKGYRFLNPNRNFFDRLLLFLH